jgi:DNA segregation ATPase FtsK/SpoIIIE, S-DNA-T family
MKLLSPTERKRLNEVVGFLLLVLGLVAWLSLLSFQAQDSSFNTASGDSRPANLVGYAGAYLADLLLQSFGLAAFLFPVLAWLLGWKWIRSEAIEAPALRILGAVLLILAFGAAVSLIRGWHLFSGAVPAGGLAGLLLANYLTGLLNPAGAVLCAFTAAVVSLYLMSSFSIANLRWLGQAIETAIARVKKWIPKRAPKPRTERPARTPAPRVDSTPPWEESPRPVPERLRRPEPEDPGVEIPICPLEETVPAPVAASVVDRPVPPLPSVSPAYTLPSTELLNEPPGRNPYDEQELKEIAIRIKSKFEEFNVLGSVVQINPGPVVTTFEFKPEAGIKYSRIITLNEDLCLGLQAESILIERIPGKPTVGIEVPNSKRELIALRQVLESEEFTSSASRLTFPLGKDINGRIRVAPLESMPHLLIAGSTGSGKSVMINSLIMSVLYKSTPDEVRMILVDPKRLELGLYEGIPHLLTPVITDPKKATNALKNAVLEMERRLRLLAERGVRNIDQYNRKMKQLRDESGNLFENTEGDAEDLRPLPYILVLIDELADLMMLEGRNVEESVTRLAQMARAVGMHLVLATQRPSVDVITGLIKANFPARISFRVATRVDSRTILDVMGSEHLLGKGDMLYLPPGSSRLVRVHGAFVTEGEINRVVDFWKQQATPEYDQSFLLAPPAEDAQEGEDGAAGEQDPMYEDAVRVVLEMGKASTSTLQRRLRLGYGRAARILDMMYKDGLIGPPDGSKPREVLKRPDWLSEVEAR